MKTKQQIENKLSDLKSKLDSRLSEKRSMLSEYMVVKDDIDLLSSRIEALEDELMTAEHEENMEKLDGLLGIQEKAVNDPEYQEYKKERSRFEGSIAEGNDTRSLHEIKMDEINLKKSMVEKDVQSETVHVEHDDTDDLSQAGNINR